MTGICIWIQARVVPGKTNRAESSTLQDILDPVWEHQLDILFVGFVNNCLRTQSSFLLCFFLGQDVILVSSLTLDLSRTCHLEALLRT
jgi:hypothetical protein